MDGCSDTCELEEGYHCWHPTEKDTAQYCEYVKIPYITRILASNDNNIIIEFSHNITFTDLDGNDLWIIIASDEHLTEFSEPLQWTLPDFYDEEQLPTQILTLLLDVPLSDRDDGPELQVRYQNTGAIKDELGYDLEYDTWAHTRLEKKDWNSNVYDRKGLIAGLGITSNILSATSMVLVGLTSLVTIKSIMPALSVFVVF